MLSDPLYRSILLGFIGGAFLTPPLVLANPPQAEVTPPDRGTAPQQMTQAVPTVPPGTGSSEVGGPREPLACFEQPVQVPFAAIIPQDDPDQLKTVSARPTLLISLPKLTTNYPVPIKGIFTLSDRNRVDWQVGPEMVTTLQNVSGTVRLPYPEAWPDLEPNHPYRWTFFLNCAPNATLSGEITYVEQITLEDNCLATLKQSGNLDLSNIYACGGIWYDFSDRLTQTEGALSPQWQSALEALNLSEIGQEPITTIDWDDL